MERPDSTEVNEEALADLITAIFDWQVAQKQNIFTYGDIELRGVLERHFYFDTINKPISLYSLLEASRSWRLSSLDERLAATYDYYLDVASASGAIRCNFFESSIKRIRLRWRIFTSWFSAINDYSQDDLRVAVGFVAFNDRFVHFFSDLIPRFSNRTAFFSINNHVSDSAVDKIGSTLIKYGKSPLKWRKINLSSTHPLASLYMSCLGMYFRAYQILAVYKPRVLVFAEGTSVDDEIFARAAKALAIPTVRLQSGRAGVLHNGYRNMCFDKMLCWGEGFVRRFKQYSPDPEYVVVGSPFLEKYVDINRPAKNDGDLKVAIFTQPVSLHITDVDYASLVRCAQEILNRYPSVTLIVRKHPADSAVHFDALRDRHPDRIMTMNPEKSSLQEVLSMSDMAIGFFSTTLSEAAAYGVLPLILKLRDQHSVFPFPERYGAAIVAVSVDQVLETIGRLLQEPDYFMPIRQRMDEFAREYFGNLDGMALSRIADHVEKSARD